MMSNYEDFEIFPNGPMFISGEEYLKQLGKGLSPSAQHT